MINTAISLGAGILAWILTTLLSDSFWAGLLPFVIIFPAVFILLGRKVTKQIEAIAAEAQRHMAQVQNARTPNQRDAILERAIATLEKGFAFRHHQFLVAGQFNAQIGQIYYIQKKFDKARPYLEKAYVRNGVSIAMLACIHFMKKQDAEMKKVFERAV
ncbi:MAG: hypothetical protein RBU37_25885, partial [Myxococcota bacterium]|nr:hypothetical protein [Myxococcota bacterium]